MVFLWRLSPALACGGAIVEREREDGTSFLPRLEVLDRRLSTRLSGDEYFRVYLEALRELASALEWGPAELRPAILGMVRRGTAGSWDHIAIVTLQQNPSLLRALSEGAL